MKSRTHVLKIFFDRIYKIERIKRPIPLIPFILSKRKRTFTAMDAPPKSPKSNNPTPKVSPISH